MLSLPASPATSPVAPADQEGVVLLEVLIAVIIFSLGILGLIGLQATTTKTTTQAKLRLEASEIANQRISSIWVDQANLASYAETNTDKDDDPLLTILPSGRRTTVVVGNQVTVTVTWEVPGINDGSGNPIANSYIAVAQVTSNPP